MKLRFGIDGNALDTIRATLDGLCEEPPIGRRLSYVYLDTPDGALAERDIALRFRRSAAIGAATSGRPWRRQEIWPKGRNPAVSLKKLGIPRLKQRLDATFTIRIERWTWTLDDGWAKVSLDRSEISTGARSEAFAEMRIVCDKRHRDKATTFAVENGAMHLSSMRARERGFALLAA